MRILSVLLNVLYQRLLLNNDRIQVLEQLRQLDHRLLDLLDRVVALLYVAERALSLAATVGLHECLLKDLRVAACFGSFPELGLGCVWTDDLVLAALLGLDFGAEGGLGLLELIDRFLDAAVEGVDLGLIAR